MSSAMRSQETTIKPVYDDQIDLTHTWGDRLHGDIFPAVYRRYRAPSNASECEKMIADLADVITSINDQYEATRQSAIGLGLDPLRDRATKDKLKIIRTARNRHEAIRRAYIHWLAIENGKPVGLQTVGATQLGTRARVDFLAQAVMELIDLYIKEMDETKTLDEVRESLYTLKRGLSAMFVSSS